MKAKQRRVRLDAYLSERGFAESPQLAQAMIMAGEVFVDGQRAAKPGTLVPESAKVEVVSRQAKYASRGGFKLEGALNDFSLIPSGLICADVGASTGGFTDCLLQHGAKHVYCIDVNTQQLAWKLQQDPRVTMVERNARELRPEDIPEPVEFAAVDVSFISVARVIPPVAGILKAGSHLLILVKPQFELPREDIPAGGIVRDESLHRKSIASVEAAANDAEMECLDVKPSRLTGAEGNQEYFLLTRKKA